MDYKIEVNESNASAVAELIETETVLDGSSAVAMTDPVDEPKAPILYFCATYVNNLYGVRNDVINIACADEEEARAKMDARCSLLHREKLDEEAGCLVDTLKVWQQPGIIAGANLMSSFPGVRTH